MLQIAPNEFGIRTDESMIFETTNAHAIKSKFDPGWDASCSNIIVLKNSKHDKRRTTWVDGKGLTLRDLSDDSYSCRSCTVRSLTLHRVPTQSSTGEPQTITDDAATAGSIGNMATGLLFQHFALSDDWRAPRLPKPALRFLFPPSQLCCFPLGRVVVNEPSYWIKAIPGMSHRPFHL